MHRLSALALLLVAATQAAAFPCTPTNLADCPMPPGSITDPSQIPQFITITWDDAVNPFAYDIVQSIVGNFTQRNGCGVPSTYFVSTTDTIPAAVQALYMSGNEIATHTMTHVGNPPEAEIVGARTWLANATGIPESRINGFRAPFLLHNPEVRASLQRNGFLYDSSIADNIPSKVSPSVRERAWPYLLDDGVPQDCNTGSCTPEERHPGLWEIPLWAVADEQERAIASMDPPGDAFENYKRELEWRLTGNRTPLGLFFHAGLQSEATRVAQLRQFIEHALAQDNVWFVTNQQLLAWMKNPVPASRVDTLLKCDKPTDIVFDGPVCETYVGNCQFGSFNSTSCKCSCMGEGMPGGYKTDATGACTVLA